MEPSPLNHQQASWGSWETQWPVGTAEVVDLVVEVHGVGAIYTRVCSESRFHGPSLCPQAACLPSLGFFTYEPFRFSDSLNALREVLLP